MLNKYDIQFKKYLSLERRFNELWEELRKYPLVKLKEPYQRGWVVYLDFREDIKKRRDYPVIKEAFDLVHSKSHTRDVKTITRIRSGRDFYKLLLENSRVEKGKRGFTLPSLISITESQYNKLNPEVKRLFFLDSYHEKWASFRGHRYFLDIPRFWLEVKSSPYMITHKYLKGGEIEEEYEEVRDKLSDYWRIFERNYSSSYPAYKDRAKVRSQIKAFIKGEKDDIEIKKIPREYDW